MSRKANAKPTRDKPGIYVSFLRSERNLLKFNIPGPSGKMGGYQNTENWLYTNIPTRGGRVFIPPEMLERILRYCLNYGGGGPNERIRKCCLPAFDCAGITITM